MMAKVKCAICDKKTDYSYNGVKYSSKLWTLVLPCTCPTRKNAVSEVQIPSSIKLIPCNIISFVFIENMIYWRQLNEGGRHVTEISSNSNKRGTKRA